ncbi:MAG: DsbA family protein, partial [Candidatus Binatia bacterium]
MISGRRCSLAIVLAWMFGRAIFPAEVTSQPISVEEALSALGKGHALGSANAPVTIVEFSDFQCSFCKKFWNDTLPRLKETYIKKGKVRFIYRHFAILGKLSEQAAQAAECAGEQGKFWEYHDRLFANQGAFTDGKLKRYAGELKLNAAAFSKCLDSGKYKEKVQGETAVA